MPSQLGPCRIALASSHSTFVTSWQLWLAVSVVASPLLTIDDPSTAWSSGPCSRPADKSHMAWIRENLQGSCMVPGRNGTFQEQPRRSQGSWNIMFTSLTIPCLQFVACTQTTRSKTCGPTELENVGFIITHTHHHHVPMAEHQQDYHSVEELVYSPRINLRCLPALLVCASRRQAQSGP